MRMSPFVVTSGLTGLGVASGRVSKRAPKVKEEPVDGEMGDVHAEDDDEGLA